MSYIERETLKQHATTYVRTQPHFHYGDWDNMCINGTEIDEIIDTCPTADVVEVVRCKDCVYNHNGGCTHSEIFDDINYNPEYYCADGERRENGT